MKPYNPNLRVDIFSPKTKTMLKRNLVRTGFLSQALLVVIPHVTEVKGESLRSSKELGHLRLDYRLNKADSLIVPGSADTTSAFTGQFTGNKPVALPEVQLNKQASVFVKSYLKREEESLTKVKERSRSYFKLIDTIFTKYGIPLELKYLAVVESDLKTTALSRVGAKGMWQLMPVTARQLGLKITRKYDERTHAYKSTVAAAKYLRDLYNTYGDWLLVLAAYNGGPGKVDHAIRKSGSRNFWVLQKYLPAESRGHVKRFIGTHYYFEGKGSIATLTKSEAAAYRKELTAFKATLEESQKGLQKDSLNVIAAIR
jgi:membrane-bound lytic murein transglycosylase D